MELVRPFHEHPLLPIGDQENHFSDKEEHYTCSGCSAPIISGSIFICSEQGCKFVLHKSCAESPMEITHFLHTQHPLVLHGKPTDGFIWHSCSHCGDLIQGFLYRCSSCDFDLDITCASMSLEVVEMELMHPFHKHPLKPGEQKHDDKQLVCSGCAAPILPGPIFICSKQQQCKFVLHKSCAQLPMEITHFSHTQHPLTLLEKPPYKYGVPTCHNCKDALEGFVYHCSICMYDLEIMCASLRSSYIVNEGDHQHKFTMVKPITFTCDICGQETKGKLSYLCTTCQAHVHPTCSSLPPIVKLFTHNCPLKLIFGHQLENPIDPIKQYSNTCWRKVDTKYWFYYCVDCEYIADIHCARGERLRDYSSERYNKIDLQTWHGHGLVLGKDEITTDDQEAVCRGCVSIISKSAPFYECKERCGYSLHESCATLFEKIRHPFHPQHDLVLLDAGHFTCNLCQLPCNGFGYYCKQQGCEYVMYDIKCALRPDVIHIEMAHQHPLRIIAEGERYDKKCRGCSSGCDSIRYSCPDCDYNLCDRCVGLPTSAKHSWDEHPLVLTYDSVTHEYGEYYCDQCEEPRDQNHWFYYCAICDRDVHPKCIGLHNLDLRTTKTYTARLHPGHSVILIANPQVYPTCGNCDLPCKDFYYQCLNCTYCVHYWKCKPSN